MHRHFSALERTQNVQKHLILPRCCSAAGLRSPTVLLAGMVTWSLSGPQKGIFWRCPVLAMNTEKLWHRFSLASSPLVISLSFLLLSVPRVFMAWCRSFTDIFVRARNRESRFCLPRSPLPEERRRTPRGGRAWLNAASRGPLFLSSGGSLLTAI